MRVDDAALLDELCEWLRIPSVSTDGENLQALRDAADWACERIVRSGGEAERVEGYGNPLVVGELRSTRPDAPTVMIYGHFDVQGVGDESLWLSDPFAPEIRGDRLYGRGTSDDKGNFYPLLFAACALHEAGELPVNVRIVIDGEEEIAGSAVARWLRDDDRLADCAIIFDSWMVDERTPAITLGLRGLAQAHITVRSGERDLHSGVYGGSVVNAAHVLQAMLDTVMPGPDGSLRAELRAGVAEPSPDEVASWRRLPPGDGLLAAVGAIPLHGEAGASYYRRTWADSSLDVTGVEVGGPRTIVPAVARATLSQRLVPHQNAREASAVLERLLREAAPAGVEVDVRFDLGDPVLFDPALPALRCAATALTRAAGVEAALVRWGGGIPVAADFAALGVPTIISGFALPGDVPHAPNESFRLDSLRLGAAASAELLVELGGLAPGEDVRRRARAVGS